MEGLGLDNMLGPKEVEALFSGDTVVEDVKEPQEDAQKQPEANKNNDDTAEVDFSDLLGGMPEEVGSEGATEGNGETPKSKNDIGAPNTTNLFSSIAKALRDEGVFPDLSDETLQEIKDASGFRKLFDDEISKSLSDRQKRIETAINGGATPEEVQGYNSDISILEMLNARNTQDLIGQEGDQAEDLRKRVMYQDYINRGFRHERAVKLVQKSIDDGNDIDDAREALQSCKEFYSQRVNAYQESIRNQQQSQRENEEKQFKNLQKQIVDTEEFFGGVKVDKATRQKAYNYLTQATFKDEDGNYMTTLQKYQRENPFEYMKNVALMYALTDGFKNVEKLTRSKVNAGLKKGFAEMESFLNNTRRNFDGTLNLANGTPDDDVREKWTLAI